MERWILAVATIVAMLIPTKHALHMFQQNRYEIGRYSKWLVGNKKMIQDMLVTTLCYIVVAGLLTYFYFQQNMHYTCFNRIAMK